MPFDYKKEYRELYQPSKKTEIVEIPAMNFIAIRGKGDPNEPKGEYQAAVGALYAVAYALKMSPKSGYLIEGYFPYVVPPLEGLWWQGDGDLVDDSRKENFEWISMIRQPDFIRREDVDWAVTKAVQKKVDASLVEFFPYCEGLCVQCTHIGSYEEEPISIAARRPLQLQMDTRRISV